MTDRTILFIGPFTDEDVRAFWTLMNIIESEHPDRVYKMLLDDPKSQVPYQDMLKELDRMVGPPKPGYKREARRTKLNETKRPQRS